LNYAQANFAAIRKALRETNWSQILHGDANDDWRTFHSLLKSLEAQHVPIRKPSGNRKKAPWMTFKAVKLIKHKQKLFKKYKTASHPAYMKAARAATKEIHRAKRSFERKLAKNIDTDRKSFYAYVRSRSRASNMIGPLVNEQGITTVTPLSLAESFNNYFASVFTIENMSTLPYICRQIIPWK